MSEYIFLDCSLYLPAYKTLIISDLHLGYEEALVRKGVLVPKSQCEDIITRLDILRKKVPITRIIFNGDIKHEFGTALNTEWREITRIVESLSGVEVVFVGGNHDMVLAPIAQKLGILLVRRYQVGPFLCIHGDKIEHDLSSDVHTLIMGHEHPCVSFRSGMRMEKYKCFLEGKFEDKSILVLPSFTTLTLGTDVLENSALCPYLSDIDQFSIYVHDGDISRFFGTVRQMKVLKESS